MGYLAGWVTGWIESVDENKDQGYTMASLWKKVRKLCGYGPLRGKEGDGGVMAMCDESRRTTDAQMERKIGRAE